MGTAKPMKNDLPFFSHDNDARNNLKMKALRARYGWTGYGQFWALNEAIAASPACRLDISRKVIRAGVACELGLTPDGFDDFLTFLSDPDECGLIVYEDGIVTTDRTQEDYERIAPEREKARARYIRKATSGEKSTFSGEKSETSGEVLYRGEESRGEEKRGEEKREEKEKTSVAGQNPRPAPVSDEPDSIFPEDDEDPGPEVDPPPDTKDALDLSLLLLAEHRKTDPKFLAAKDDRKTAARWAEDVEKLIRIDGRPEAEIREVILWVKTPGNFWLPNIESGKKLREKYPTLLAQMQREKTNPRASPFNYEEAEKKQRRELAKKYFGAKKEVPV